MCCVDGALSNRSYIAVEMAGIMNDLGSKITLIVRHDRGNEGPLWFGPFST